MPENPNQQQQQHHLVLYNQQQKQPPQRPVTTQSRMRITEGEIVEVQGGHIVRSTGRKDRHSKVCTAKGPRDRRVRLSAHTAIQFYDVQDRLGYDRPSKAVDWLMKNAKAAIDELAELPAWNPTATTNAAASAGPNSNQLDSHVHGESSNKQMNVDEPGSSSGYGFGGGGGGTSFLPPSLDSDSIADTIKSFFPMGAGGAAPSSAAPSDDSPIGFQNYPPDLLSRSTSSQNQDLRLSLQSFQDPIFHHPNDAAAAAATHHQHQQNHPNAHGQQMLFPGFDTTSGLVPWNVGESSSGGGGGGGGGNVGGGYIFNVPFQQQAVAMHQMIGHHGQFFTQREPLQSNNPSFARAWVDPMAAAAGYPTMQHSVIHPSFQSVGFASGSSGFSGFQIPARIRGEEEHDGLSDKPSSASSGSHH